MSQTDMHSLPATFPLARARLPWRQGQAPMTRFRIPACLCIIMTNFFCFDPRSLGADTRWSRLSSGLPGHDFPRSTKGGQIGQDPLTLSLFMSMATFMFMSSRLFGNLINGIRDSGPCSKYRMHGARHGAVVRSGGTGRGAIADCADREGSEQLNCTYGIGSVVRWVVVTRSPKNESEREHNKGEMQWGGTRSVSVWGERYLSRKEV